MTLSNSMFKAVFGLQQLHKEIDYSIGPQLINLAPTVIKNIYIFHFARKISNGNINFPNNDTKKKPHFLYFTFTDSLYVLAFCLKRNVLCLLHLPSRRGQLARQVVFRLPHFTFFSLQSTNPFLMHVYMTTGQQRESRVGVLTQRSSRREARYRTCRRMKSFHKIRRDLFYIDQV